MPFRLALPVLCRKTPAAATAAGGHAGFWGKPTTQPAVCQVAAGVAASSRPAAQTQRCSGQAGGGTLNLVKQSYPHSLNIKLYVFFLLLLLINFI